MWMDQLWTQHVQLQVDRDMVKILFLAHVLPTKLPALAACKATDLDWQDWLTGLFLHVQSWQQHAIRVARWKFFFSWPMIPNRCSLFYYTAPTGVRVEILNSTSVRVTWQWSGNQSMCWNTTFVRYQSEWSAPMLMKLDDPYINSVIVNDLQCGTRYNFTVVVVNTTTFINESNTASIHLGGCTPSITPSPTLMSVVSAEVPQSE